MTVHVIPSDGEVLTPCCGRTLDELPDGDTVAIGANPAPVNCPGPAAAGAHDPKAPSSPGDAPAGMTGGPTSAPGTPGAGPERQAADIPLDELRTILTERTQQIQAYISANPYPIEQAALVALENRARWEALLDGVFGGEDSQDRLGYEISVREHFLVGLKRTAERSKARIEAQQAEDRRRTLLEGVNGSGLPPGVRRPR